MNKYDRTDLLDIATRLDLDEHNDGAAQDAHTLRRIAQVTDEYNGWTNRETWAVALHINNDQGWQESVHEALTDAMVTKGETAADEGRAVSGQLAAWEAGDIIRENVESVLQPDDDDWADSGYGRQMWGVASDIGSLYRVDWDELGRSFLSDLEDQA